MEKGEVPVLLSEANTVLGDAVGPTTSTSLDTLQFKHDFFEVLEELQLRRQEDEEHKKKLQVLLKDKYELEKKLEDCTMVNGQLVEKYKTEQEEMRHNYEEKMRALHEEKTKATVNSLCEDGQVSRLKDEIRALHLHKYNLEKKVNEQEHKLHLQMTSHEQFLLLVRQLEEKCTTLSQQVIEVNEHFDLLSNNVNEAVIINTKLERQQKHHGCVVSSYQDELGKTKEELLKLTTKLSIDQHTNKILASDNSHIKNLEHQLKMQQEMTVLLEKQIEELQRENTSIAGALKESNLLLEWQTGSYEQTKNDNTLLHEQLTATKNHSEAVSIELAEKTFEFTQLEQKHQQHGEMHSKKFADMEQRLRALQDDFVALQKSCELLQHDKHQWLKEKAEYITIVADKTEKIISLEEQLNKQQQFSELNLKPMISTNKSPDLIKRSMNDDEKAEDLPNNKRMCLLPSITQDDNLTVLLPSSVHDSPAMPVPSSSHDPPATSQSSSGDLLVKFPYPSSHEHPATPPQSNLKDLVSSPSSHDLLATPPGSPSLKDVSNGSSQDNNPNVELAPPDPVLHDSSATSPNLHDPIKPHCSSHDTIPSYLNEHNTSIPLGGNHDSFAAAGLSNLPLPSTKQQDQLQFSDPTIDIINTQLNKQITEVQHFLKTDRLKRTRLPNTNN